MNNRNSQMRLCLFWFPPGSHPGGWRMPDAVAASESSFEVYLEVTRIAELRLALARLMIQMSRSFVPGFFLEKTTYRPSGDQSGTPIFGFVSHGSDDMAFPPLGAGST